MTEKEGNNQGAFWDISENTNVDPERIIDEPDNTSNQFQPHEPREVAKVQDAGFDNGSMVAQLTPSVWHHGRKLGPRDCRNGWCSTT